MTLNVEKIKDIFLLVFKNLLKSWYFYVLFFLPLFFILPTMTIGSVEIMYMGAFSGTMLTSTILIYGFVKYSMKDFISNKTNNNKWNEFTAIFALILFVNALLFFTILFWFFILLLIPNLLVQNSTSIFPFLNHQITFSFINASWAIAFYYIFSFTLLSYAFSYFIKSFSKNINIYLLFSLSYVTLTIFYGGVVNSNFQLALDNTVSISQGQIYVSPSSTSVHNANWYISQFVPVYHLNQFCFFMFLNVGFTSALFPGHPLYLNANYFNFLSLQWALLIVIPYFWIIIYLISGKLINKM